MKVGYARVSSKNQAETDALNQQIDRLQRYGVEKVLSDIQSGRVNARKNYNLLLKLCREGCVSEIVITRLDRLGRSVIEIHRAIAIFQENKVKLTILDAPLENTDSAFGWLTVQHISAMAEFESRLLSERTKHGSNFYRQNLKYFGSPPFGYDKDESRKLTPHPVNWAIAKQLIQNLRTHSFTSISKWLNSEHGVQMYPTSFRRWLHNPALRGHTVYKTDEGEIIHYNTHEPLMSESEFQELAQITALKVKKDPSLYRTHYLAGLFRCGVCGAGMSKSSISSKNKTLNFQCVKYKKFGLSGCSNKKTISDSIIRRKTIAELLKYAEEITAEIETKTLHEEAFDPHLLKLNKQLSSLKKLGDNPAISAAIKNIEAQILARKHQQGTRKVSLREHVAILSALRQEDFFSELSDCELRAICLRFIESVKFMGEKQLSFSMHLRME